MPTGAQWITVAEWVIRVGVGVLMFTVLRGFQSGRWVQARDDKLTDLERSIGALTVRLDKGGKEMSDLASEVQGMPERLRTIFVPRELYGASEAVNGQEHHRMLAEIEKLWGQVRSTRGGNR